ncbi:MAG TPA: lytic transglycosylase domain-containing protein [Stellaceae bacterium]|nr:lytic transglycosylase domain-containing protein [Stellaceae bacterium]
MISLGRALLLAGALLLAARPALADPADSRQMICQTISDAALANGLPVGFLARLLWTESGFRSAATSPAGAEGVAQFMPETAARRGLADPRDPLQSVHQAARLLGELGRQFGNLGLAAAAYNAGSARVAKWLQGVSTLPVETRFYVLAITGRSPEDWAAMRGGLYTEVNYPLPGLDCLNVATAAARHGMRAAPSPSERIWQARLDTHLEAAIVLLGGLSRSEVAPAPPVLGRGQHDALESLCGAIRAKGAVCQVFGR